MKIDGSGNFTRELRQLAGDVEARRTNEESDFDRQRLADLGKVLLIAADMAAGLEGQPIEPVALTPEMTQEWFDDIVFREWPDGPTPGATA